MLGKNAHYFENLKRNFGAAKWADLYQRDGIFYEKKTRMPFTGFFRDPAGKEYPSGKKELVEGNFEDGKRVGIWIQRHPNKQIHYAYTYKNGVRHGVSRSYEPYETAVNHQEFHDGIESVSMELEGDRYLRSITLPLNESLEGDWKLHYNFVGYREAMKWSADGNLSPDRSDDARPIYREEVWGRISGTGKTKDGKREGPWLYYSIDGELAKESGIYRDGEKVSELP